MPGDFEPVEKPLSLALGTKDSLLDQGTVGKIMDVMAKKTEVPHEIRVSSPKRSLEVEVASGDFALTCWDSCMRTRSTALRYEVIGVAIRIRRLWTSRRSRASSSSRSTCRRSVCHSRPAGALVYGTLGIDVASCLGDRPSVSPIEPLMRLVR